MKTISSKTIFLVDPLWGGHHQLYLKLYTKALIQLKYNVVLFCENPKEIAKSLKKNGKNRELLFAACYITEPKVIKADLPIITSFLTSLSYWLAIKKKIYETIKKINCKPDLVFFLWLDSYLGYGFTHHLIDLIFPYKWSGLYFHPRHLRRENKSLIEKITRPTHALDSSNCKAVAVLDEGIISKLSRELKGKNIVSFPDVTDDSVPNKESLLIKKIKHASKGRYLISSLGSIDKRKGTLILLELAKNESNKNTFFLFAGEIHESSFTKEELKKLNEFINSDPDNCFFYTHRISSDKEFNSLVQFSNLLYLVYLDFPHSSNFLTKASMFRKPVIVNRDYCMSERVRKYGIGISVKSADLVEIKTAIDKIQHGIELNDRPLDFRFSDYCESHSFENLKRSLRFLIEKQ